MDELGFKKGHYTWKRFIMWITGGRVCIWERAAAFSMRRSTRPEMNMTCAAVSEETRLIGTKCACL